MQSIDLNEQQLVRLREQLELVRSTEGSKEKVFRWAAKKVFRKLENPPPLKTVQENIQRVFRETDRRTLTRTISHYFQLIFDVNEEGLLGLLGSCKVALQPHPPLDVMNYSQMIAAGFTDVSMIEGSDWVDLAIESSEKNPAFGEQSWISYDVWLGISRRDNLSVQYLVDSNRRIWGYTFMAALKKPYFEEFMLGDYYEPDLLLEHTLPILPYVEPFYVFIFGVDTHPLLWSEEVAKNTLGALKLLLKIRGFF